MLTYYAPDLENRIPNVFFIPGSTSTKETYASIKVYNYTRNGLNWSAPRISSAAETVSDGVSIYNSFGGGYTLTRTGVQFSTTWGIVPAGIAMNFKLDYFNIPHGETFKIQAFKGNSNSLTGNPNEYSIPLNQGLIPYTNEIAIDGVSQDSLTPILYFNQTAINDFLANPNQNLFILGEYDYNNIAPTNRYECSDPQALEVGLLGIT